MIRIERTTSWNKDLRSLVELLDIELAMRDGKDNVFYSQFNKIDHLDHCVIVYSNKLAISCGAFKKLDGLSIEIKRMYTIEGSRGKGMASLVLTELERWAQELGFSECLLETGKKQPEAIALYLKMGFSFTQNYGPYIGIENSICFKKDLLST